MAEQTPDLRERIEQALYHHDYIDRTPGTARDCRSAADAVMAVVSPALDPDVVALATECGDLRAEVERLRAEDAHWRGQSVRALDAEVERLRAALARVRAVPPRHWDPFDADSAASCSARGYNAALRDLRAALAAGDTERCDPVAGTHVDPHRGCILR